MSKHEFHKTVVINQSMLSSNTFTVNFDTSFGFQPKQVIIRQMVYTNIAGADSGTYLVWSSLTNDYVGAVYVGIQGCITNPGTVLSIPIVQPSITFRLIGALPQAYVIGPSGLLTMTLEFVG